MCSKQEVAVNPFKRERELKHTQIWYKINRIIKNYNFQDGNNSQTN